jgi:hypothetical protein
MLRTTAHLLCAALALSSLSTPPALAEGAGAATVGRLAFANSGAAAAQADFLYGLAQLHNFEYEDAAAAFRRAQAADPGFALATWGEAMTFNHPIWQEQDLAAARAVLARLGATPAERLAKAPTEREKDYLRVLDVLYGEGSKEERDFRYAAAMAELHRKYPDDVDAAAFHALALLGTAHAGRDFAIYMRSAALLEEVWCRAPEHPGVVHYLIHSYDDPIHAPLGLRAARVYARLAPAAGHAQHMTSHIFLALGLWDEVVASNQAALGAMNHMREGKGMHHRACGHYAFWLEYGYLQQGRVGAARQMLDACREEVRAAGAGAGSAAGRNSLDPDTTSVGSLVAMQARYLLDTGDWQGEVAGWEIDPLGLPAPRLTLAFLAGWKAAEKGDLAAAHAALERLKGARQDLEAYLDEKKESDPSYKARAEILVDQLQALLAHKEGKTAAAVEQLRRAARVESALPAAFGPPLVDKPSHEMLGEMLLAGGDPAQAILAFQGALARAPERTASLLGLARAATQSGDKALAAETYAKLRQIWRQADRVPEEVR